MKKYLIVLIALVFLNCSKNDDNCTWYIAVLGDACDCAMHDFSCINNLHVSRKEYLRLEELERESTEPCLYAETFSVYTGDAFEGYLLDLTSMPCPEIEGY